jgi:hypothetical protein
MRAAHARQRPGALLGPFRLEATMVFRRLTLLLALLTAPAQGADFDTLIEPTKRPHAPGVEHPETSPIHARRIEDLLLRPDGSIAGAVQAGSAARTQVVPWSRVRFDHAGDREDTLWVEIPSRWNTLDRVSRGTRPGEDVFALSGLGGFAVTSGGGDVVGVIRGGLICLASGRIVALAVDVGPLLGGESRLVALPWSSLRVEHARNGNWVVALGQETGIEWVRAAPELMERAAHERFSARLDGRRAGFGVLDRDE